MDLVLLFRGDPAAPQIGAINHVIVQQRRGVDELDDGSKKVGLAVNGASGTGGQQGHGGPQTLAARVNDMTANVIDQRDFGSESVADDIIDMQQIIRDRVQQGF